MNCMYLDSKVEYIFTFNQDVIVVEKKTFK